ncbi:MAG TPA: UDP-glucose 4-epimerase GalE [Flavobacteriaceae bacterium]|nr:UDP-glucose 4-epimerase GalE [Flavobacteriaceae bacterium]
MGKILVTGGLGYIGSHTVVALHESGYSVLVVDDLSNSERDVLKGLDEILGFTPEFIELDLRHKSAVKHLFDEHSFDGVIHFAASKAVGESVENPLLYYENNINGLVYVLQNCVAHGVHNFIFSSSCTVYGEPDHLPIDESAPIKRALSPYGNTKQIAEEMLHDLCRVSPLRTILLRYFNPIGAHDSALIGELPKGVPQNLVPFITQTAAGLRQELSVFGDDYPTPDGSCIRDYIHVMDLAEAHVVALDRLVNNAQQEAFEVFNLGTGQGNSVLEVIQTFEQATGMNLPYKIVDRRAGDVIAVYADTTKATKVLGWSTKRDLSASLSSAWAWEKRIRGL